MYQHIQSYVSKFSVSKVDKLEFSVSVSGQDILVVIRKVNLQSGISVVLHKCINME